MNSKQQKNKFNAYVTPGKREELLIFSKNTLEGVYYSLGFLVPGEKEIITISFFLQEGETSDIKCSTLLKDQLTYTTFSKKGALIYQKNRYIKHYDLLLEYAEKNLGFSNERGYSPLERVCYDLLYIYATIEYEMKDFYTENPFKTSQHMKFFNEILAKQKQQCAVAAG